MQAKKLAAAVDSIVCFFIYLCVLVLDFSEVYLMSGEAIVDDRA